MFKKLVILGLGLALAVGTSARADELTTNITLQAPYTGGGAIGDMVNITAGPGSGLTYTVNEGKSQAVGNTIYEVSATLLSSFKVDGGTAATLKGGNLVLVTATQGQTVPPVPGATITANTSRGIAAIYDIGATLFNNQNTATWGPGTPGAKLVYTATIVPATNVGQGPGGDSTFGGQPASTQNQSSFVAAAGVQAVGAFIVHTNANPVNGLNQLFSTPLSFDGFQAEINAINSLSPTGAPYTSPPFPTNANLNAIFDALALLDPTVAFGSPTPFTDNGGFAPNAAGSNGDALQQFGITNYPIQSLPPGVGIPEPASMVLWGLGAVGIGAWVRRRRAKKAIA
jgi:hypothetical protein